MPEEQYYTEGQVELLNDLRKVWLDLSMWTREYIISSQDNKENQELIRSRLQELPGEYIDIIRLYYSEERLDQLELVLSYHIKILISLIDSIQTGDINKQIEERKNWYAYVDYVGTQLQMDNSTLDLKILNEMLFDYFKMTEIEIVKELNKQYKESIEIHELIESKVLEIADYFLKGLTDRFII